MTTVVKGGKEWVEKRAALVLDPCSHTMRSLPSDFLEHPAGWNLRQVHGGKGTRPQAGHQAKLNSASRLPAAFSSETLLLTMWRNQFRMLAIQSWKAESPIQFGKDVDGVASAFLFVRIPK